MSTRRLMYQGARLYDLLRDYWERPAVSRRLYRLLLSIFILFGLLCLPDKAGIFPYPGFPDSPFYAIRLAFTLLLAVELIELIFAMADSVSLAMAKQLEIMALLLLRESFVDISLLDLSTCFGRNWFILMQVCVTSVSGLALFVIKGFFQCWHQVQEYRDMHGYVSAKKCVCLVLLLCFVFAGCHDLLLGTGKGNDTTFFSIFYTALIFTDITLILIGQYFTSSFSATFRNSGYAVSTLFMRLSMGAPHHIGALLCVFAGLYLLALTKAIAFFGSGSACRETSSKV